MFRTGDLLGPYTLIKEIGRGTFGVVWLAEKRTTIVTTKVAVKLPLEDKIDLNLIKQEANLWATAIGHPNVLPIIEADIYNNQVVIVSEYAPDGSLKAWIDQHGDAVPPTEEAINLVLGILAGLEHLHSRRIIHRDLKPDNILLQGRTPRLADFGIARVLKTVSQYSTVAGTPAYMAPEAFDGKRSEQTDVWSVGVIFYQLLAGYLPFPQIDFTSLMKAITTLDPAPLSTSIPEALRKVVACALSKETAQRYKSAAEMHRALRGTNQSKKPSESDPTIIIDEPTKVRNTTNLIKAVSEGDIGEVNALLANGADANIKDNHGNAALALSIKNGHLAIVRALLAKGANVNAKDNIGRTSLMLALSYLTYGKGDKITLALLDAGADVRAKDDNGATVLLHAMSGYNYKLVEALLAKGVDVNAKDSEGRTALMMCGNSSAIQALVDKGADIDAKDNKGETALMWAVRYNHYFESAPTLLNKGANVDVMNNEGQTALMMATSILTNTDILKDLLDKGADVNAKDNEGRTALMRAAANKYATPDIVQLLLDKKADVNAEDKKGWTALLLAEEVPNTDKVIEMLKKAGAK